MVEYLFAGCLWSAGLHRAVSGYSARQAFFCCSPLGRQGTDTAYHYPYNNELELDKNKYLEAIKLNPTQPAKLLRAGYAGLGVAQFDVFSAALQSVVVFTVERI